MVQGSEDLALVAEALQKRRSIETTEDELDRNLFFVQAVNSGGPKHLPHTTVADLLQDLIHADSASHPRGWHLCLCDGGSLIGSHGPLVQKLGVRLPVVVEQRFNFAQDVWITLAGLFDVSRLRLAFACKGAIEHLLHTLPFLGIHGSPPTSDRRQHSEASDFLGSRSVKWGRRKVHTRPERGRKKGEPSPHGNAFPVHYDAARHDEKPQGREGTRSGSSIVVFRTGVNLLIRMTLAGDCRHSRSPGEIRLGSFTGDDSLAPR